MKKSIHPFFACIIFNIFFAGDIEYLFPKKVTYNVTEESGASKPPVLMKVEAYKNSLNFFIDGKQSALLELKKPSPCPGPLPCPPGPCDPPAHCNIISFSIAINEKTPILTIKEYKYTAELKEIQVSPAYLNIIKNSKTKRFILTAQQVSNR